MRYFNEGTLVANKPLTDEAWKLIEECIESSILEELPAGTKDADRTICINGECGDLDLPLEKLTEMLTPLGYVLNGEIHYSGDYNGSYVIQNNNLCGYDAEEIWRIHATDEELIEVLQDRGYLVIPPEEEN